MPPVAVSRHPPNRKHSRSIVERQCLSTMSLCYKYPCSQLQSVFTRIQSSVVTGDSRRHRKIKIKPPYHTKSEPRKERTWQIGLAVSLPTAVMTNERSRSVRKAITVFHAPGCRELRCYSHMRNLLCYASILTTSTAPAHPFLGYSLCVIYLHIFTDQCSQLPCRDYPSALRCISLHVRPSVLCRAHVLSRTRRRGIISPSHHSHLPSPSLTLQRIIILFRHRRRA